MNSNSRFWSFESDSSSDTRHCCGLRFASQNIGMEKSVFGKNEMSYLCLLLIFFFVFFAWIIFSCLFCQSLWLVNKNFHMRGRKVKWKEIWVKCEDAVTAAAWLSFWIMGEIKHFCGLIPSEIKRQWAFGGISLKIMFWPLFLSIFSPQDAFSPETWDEIIQRSACPILIDCIPFNLNRLNSHRRFDIFFIISLSLSLWPRTVN